VNEIMDNAARAARFLRRLDQRQTDRIVRAVYLAAFGERVRLARMAHEETGIGVWQHKAIKNVISTQLVYNNIRKKRTVGVISEEYP
jgi:acetaldehyde dehydrogenase/alcohol dehydrogenase